jgi:hypothetical protein
VPGIAALAPRDSLSEDTLSLSDKGTLTLLAFFEAGERCVGSIAGALGGPAGFSWPHEPAHLAANVAGEFVLDWCSFPESERSEFVATPCDRVVAALGRGERLEEAQLLTPPEQVLGGGDGMDAAGEAAVVWRDSLAGSTGISLALLRPSS